jgi:hypothetical protein
MSELAKRGACRLGENPEFLTEAFALYCEGMSARAIVERLAAEWPGVGLKLLERLVARHGWRAERAEYLKLFAKARQETGGLKAQAILELQEIRKTLRLRLGSLNWAEIQQYRGVLDDLMMLTGESPKLKLLPQVAVSTHEELKELFEVLDEDPVIGPVLRKRRAAVLREWKRRRGGNNGSQIADSRSQKGGRGGAVVARTGRDRIDGIDGGGRKRTGGDGQGRGRTGTDGKGRTLAGTDGRGLNANGRKKA